MTDDQFQALITVLASIADEIRQTRELQTEQVQEQMFHVLQEEFKRQMAGGGGLLVPQHVAKNLAER